MLIHMGVDKFTHIHSFAINVHFAHGRYVVHSNNIQKVGEVPTVRLNYDILPIVVQFSEKKQAFYHFITNVSFPAFPCLLVCFQTRSC